MLELQDLQVDSRLHVLGIKWVGAYRVLDRLFGLVEKISELANADMDEHLYGCFISIIDASQQLKHLAQYRKHLRLHANSSWWGRVETSWPLCARNRQHCSSQLGPLHGEVCWQALTPGQNIRCIGLLAEIGRGISVCSLHI